MRTTLLVSLFFCVGQLAAAPKPIYRNEREFALPFSPRQADTSVVEYRLYVSFNGGPFEYYTKVGPNAERFPFRTDRDGTFAFAVQQASKNGGLSPAREQLQAMMTVIIDTRRPRIEVTPFVEGNLVGGLRWNITDDDVIDLRSVRLEFKWPGENVGWQPLDPNVEFRSSDSQKWNFTAGRPRMLVHVLAKDLAGNSAVSPEITVPPLGEAKTVDNGQDVMIPAKGAPGAAGPSGGLPGPQTLYWPKREVEIKYNASFGPAGLDQLMLFFTEDGKKWQIDPKQKSSQKPQDLPGNPGSIPGESVLKFEAPKDGPFGFIAVVKNKVGQSSNEPGDGALAQLNVVVDTVKPEMKLIEARVVANNGAGALLDLRWTAKDANLSRTPIQIDYRDTKADKPASDAWHPIADQLDNTGGYRWPIPQGLERLRVRIRAVDLAGNTGEDESRDDIIVDLTPPSIEIRLAPPK